MTLARLTLLIAALFMFGCPDPKAPTDNLNSNDTSNTIYDNTAVMGSSMDSDRPAQDLIAEDQPIAWKNENISRERLDTIDQESLKNKLNLNWTPIHFDFDKANLTEEAKINLQKYSQTLKDNSNLVVLIEGHCDTRGTEEYNMALGERRAQQVKRYLLELGVRTSQLKTISYGEIKPMKLGENEAIWAINRRVSFTF